MRARAYARLLMAAVLAALCALQVAILWRAPPAWLACGIVLTLANNQSVALSARALGAPGTDADQLAVRRDASGRWWLRNLSAATPVTLRRADQSVTRSGSVTLRPAMMFQVAGARFDVEQVTSEALTFRRAGQHWRYDGATVYRDGSAQQACPATRQSARVLAFVIRALPLAIRPARAATFGASIDCDNRIGVKDTDSALATLRRVDGEFTLSDTSGQGQVATASAAAPDHPTLLAREDLALDGVRVLGVGHTSYALHMDGAHLRLRPSGRLALFSAPHTVRELPLQWQWQRRTLWSAPDATASLWVGAMVSLMLAACALAWQRGCWPCARDIGWHRRVAVMSAATLAICAIAALLLQRAGTPPGVGWSMLLACAGLCCCAVLPGRLTLLAATACVLLGVGLAAQLALGIGAQESSMLRHYQKSACLLAIGTSIASLLRLRFANRAPIPTGTVIEWTLGALGLIALAGLAAQVLWGSEAGVFDIQPVEFAKLALCALCAHCLAVGVESGRRDGDLTGRCARVLRVASPTLLFIALMGTALVQVSDYSPLVLLLIWSMTMAFVFACATRRYYLVGALVAAGVAAISVIVQLRLQGDSAGGGLAFYADRFQVWRDPAAHPHTGLQLLLGARAIAQGAYWGADGMLGFATLGQAIGSALQVPAVQDDFAPSLFLHRHGIAGAIALWSVQMLFVLALAHMAARAHAVGASARHFRQAWWARFCSYALGGGAAFVLGHLLLSWGTNLSILPIMGQPMSFLSAGGSHLLFFLLPLLTLSAMCSQSFEEKSSCPSMSNAKF